MSCLEEEDGNDCESRNLEIAIWTEISLLVGGIVGMERAAGDYNANLRAVQVVFEIAAAKQAKPGQISRAWLLQKGDDIVPIPGTKRRTFLEENVAVESVMLGPAQMKALDYALGAEKVSVKRYPDWINGDD